MKDLVPLLEFLLTPIFLISLSALLGHWMWKLSEPIRAKRDRANTDTDAFLGTGALFILLLIYLPLLGLLLLGLAF